MTDLSALYAPTELEPWQQLVRGIPLSTITGLFGPAASGKSTLGAQLLLEHAVRKGHNVAAFDTELSIHTFADLVPRLSDRYGADIGMVKVTPNIDQSKKTPSVTWEMDDTGEHDVTFYVVFCPDITPILILHGRGAEVDISKKGKIEAKSLRGTWTARGHEPFSQFIADHGVGSVLYDSVTNPLNEITTNQSNFPGRTDFTQLWLIQAQKAVAWAHDIPVFATFHESANPANPFYRGLVIKGGVAVEYAVKHQIYFMSRKDNALTPSGAPKAPELADTGVSLWLARHPSEAPWKRWVSIDHTEQGFIPYE